MPIADAIRETLGSQSMIRKMFEEGAQLKKQHGAENVFDFSLGNPDLDPPAAFYQALTKLINEGKKGSHGYMPNAGFPEVRQALASKASAEQGVNLDGSHIVMSCGAAGGLNAVFKCILNPGDEVIVSRPFFMEYRPYTANHGGRLVEVDSLPDFALDVQAIKAKLSQKTAAVLINSPHNPTGRIYSAKSLAQLSAALEEHGRNSGRAPYLVCDEPYRDLAYDGIEVPPVLSAYSESIVVSSFSKSLSLPGERIGYIAVAPLIHEKDNLLAALAYATRILGFVNAPALMQRVVGELGSVKADLEIYARRRAAFCKVLDDAGIEYAKPEGAFYLFCQVPRRGTVPGGDDLAFVEHLKKHLILGVPGSGFGKSGWLRFAYCVDEKIIAASSAAFKQAMEEWLISQQVLR
ncbi:MAG: pyridoxal phosphate-dependent aminotransferase [Treponema sp.]|nr:pyridoxal phosphate-dependent aminotransferase [Treponema sp.]